MFNLKVKMQITVLLNSILIDCSRAEAFEIGQQIAKDVSSTNPYPMKLKFEKIMQPCVLLTKKRYVGNSYENSPNEEPKFDAKGIETVRRDSCLFVSKAS